MDKKFIKILTSNNVSPGKTRQNMYVAGCTYVRKRLRYWLSKVKQKSHNRCNFKEESCLNENVYTPNKNIWLQCTGYVDLIWHTVTTPLRDNNLQYLSVRFSVIKLIRKILQSTLVSRP